MQKLARRSGSRRCRLEKLETRQMLAAHLQNPGNPLDVDADLLIVPFDALQIINELNRARRSEATNTGTALSGDTFYDVDGDGRVEPIDALLVINALNRPNPEVTFNLTHDSDSEQGSNHNRTTSDLGIVGRISFAADNPELFIGVGLGSPSRWIDASEFVDPESGKFAIDDAAMRRLLGEDLSKGETQLWFGTGQAGARNQSMLIEAINAPPRPQLVAAELDEDASIQFDLIAATADVDDRAEQLTLEIMQGPSFGSLIEVGGGLRYSPVADYFGPDEIVYRVSDGQDASDLTTLSLTVAPVNDLPEIAPLSDRTLSLLDKRVEQVLTVDDVEGDPILLVARASVANPLAAIRDTYGLSFRGDYFFDITELDEKWLFGDAGTSFFILPNGDLIQWNGSYVDTGTPQTLIARLDSAVYDDPSLLWDAAAEIVAPATVLVEDQTLIVDPHDGVFGEIIVRVAANDGADTSVASFTLHIGADQESYESENAILAQLLEQAETLSHEQIPAFIDTVNQQLDAFGGLAEARLTDLLRQLSQLYEATERSLTASADWASEERRLREQEVASIEHVHAELAILQSEYRAAWAAIQSRLDDAADVDQSGPPVFVNGSDLDELSVRRGETLELDLRAIHPSHQPFYYFPEAFEYDPEQLGFLSLSPQTGLFTWQTPSNAAGTYTFTVVAEVNGNNTAEVTFQVSIDSNDPAIGSLIISPSTITDEGSDPIVLTAQGVTHPSGRVDRVYFYQDADGNGTFEEDVDRYLGRDEQGEDGWSWSGLPLPVNGATATTFFAQAIYYTFSAANYSEPAAVTANVIPTPDLDVDLVEAIDDSEITVVHYFGTSVHPDPDWYAPFDTGQAISAYPGSYSAPGIYLQWRTGVDITGVGANAGAPLRLTNFGVERFVVRADADGNAVVIFSTGPFAADGRGPGVWMVTANRATRTVSTPVALASGSIDGGNDGYAFTFAMNESGDGVVAWKGYYSAPTVRIQPFTDSGRSLGSMTTVEANGGFHDGGTWYSSDINATGDYIVAWNAFAAMGQTGGSASPTISNSSVDFPAHAAISDNGWAVISRFGEAQILAPGGNAVGQAFETTDDTSGYVFRRLFDVSFLDDNVISFLWSAHTSGRNPTVRMLQRRFELDVQSDLTAQSLRVADELGLHAGETINLEYAVGNLGLATSQPADVTFHLSHDENINAAARLLGTATIGAIAAQSVGPFVAQVTLPASSDPFWLAGSTSLRLIMTIPASGSRTLITIPFVTTDRVDAPDGGGGGDDPSDPTDPGGDPGDGSPKYIRPNVVLDQLGVNGVSMTVDLMELIGRQLVSSLRSLRTQSPLGLAERLESMAGEVELRLDTFYLEKYTLVEAKNQALATAESEKFAAINAALGEFDTKLASQASARDRIVADNQTAIDEELERSNKALHDRRENLREDIADKRAEITAAENAIAQLEQGSGENGFALGGVIGQLIEEGENAIDCGRDPIECGEKTMENIDNRLRELRKIRDDVIATVTPIIQKLQSALDNALSEAQTAFDRVVKPFQEKIDQAKDAFESGKAKLLKKRDQLVTEAEERFDEVVADIPRDLATGIEIIKTSAAPALEAAAGRIDAAIDSVTAPGGLLEVAQTGLESIATHNPFGTVEQILDGTGVLADIAKDTLSGVGEFLQPVFPEIENSAGKFVDWAKETGGNVSDWTQDTGGDIAEWTKDRIDDLLHSEITVYSVCSAVDLSLNFLNASVYVNAEIGPGLEYDSRKLKELVAGQISLPDIDPLKAASTFFGFQLNESSNYEEVRDDQYTEFGPQNVYFASRRFVSYVGVETVAEIAAEAFLTGGAAAQDALADLAEQVRLELNDVMAWLQIKGESQLDQFAAGMIQSIFTQTDYVTPHIELRWTPVTFRYELQEGPVLGKAIDAISGGEMDLSDLVDGHELAADLPHAAFTIVWKIPDAADPLSPEAVDAELNSYLGSFEEQQFSGDAMNAELLDLAMAQLEGAGASEELLQFVSAIQGRSLGALDFEDLLAQRLRQDLGLNEELLGDAFSTGKVIVDLSSGTLGDRLSNVLGKLTFGNRGSASVDRLELNLSTFSLDVSATLCHEHTWGSVSSIVAGTATAA